METIKKNFVLHCLDSQCEACRHECTAAQASFSGTAHEFDPLKTVQKLSEGQLTELLESEDIWKCVSCHKCEILCPANRGLEKTFAKLRSLARKRGITPKIVSDKLAAVEATGIGLPKISDDLRDDIDLGPVTLPAKKEIEKILKTEK
jgi:heterodisulfide reductase subunit C